MAERKDNDDKGLSRETLERMAREWAGKKEGQEFSIRAGKDEKTGEDVIQTVDGTALDPENPYSEGIWRYLGRTIHHDEMDSDIPTKEGKAPKK